MYTHICIQYIHVHMEVLCCDYKNLTGSYKAKRNHSDLILQLFDVPNLSVKLFDLLDLNLQLFDVPKFECKVIRLLGLDSTVIRRPEFERKIIRPLGFDSTAIRRPHKSKHFAIDTLLRS